MTTPKISKNLRRRKFYGNGKRFFACTSGRCNRQSEFTLLHFTIFH